MSLRCIAILPARLGSTRLPRKVLLAETGLPLFVHTARSALACQGVTQVVVATDSEEVIEAARRHELPAVMTSVDHQSGTDRVREALDQLERLGQPDKLGQPNPASQGSVPAWDVVLNVQADEPDLNADDLERLIQEFQDPECQAATLGLPILNEGDLQRPSVVKIVLDERGRALYFSRAPIPSRLHARGGADADLSQPWGLRHIGVYAYRPDALRKFCDLPPGRLEALENLEQLRWLEHGHAMRVLPATHAPRGIDTPQDYAEFVARQDSSPNA